MVENQVKMTGTPSSHSPPPLSSSSSSPSVASSSHSMRVPRIRVLIAPDMLPFVLPLHKIQTWSLFIDNINKLFGENLASSPHFRVCDGDGNTIAPVHWEDLLEQDMGTHQLAQPVQFLTCMLISM
jgi:hypothetical protein